MPGKLLKSELFIEVSCVLVNAVKHDGYERENLLRLVQISQGMAEKSLSKSKSLKILRDSQPSQYCDRQESLR